MTTAETLAIWVVYDHPLDFPDTYVARQHIVSSDGQQPTDQVMAGSLDSIRTELADQGLICITRSENDDPVIVEVWL